MPNLVRPTSDEKCVSLIGMAGAGKTTLGRALAARLGWAFLDTDLLLEAYYGQSLPELLAVKGHAGFVSAEEELVASLGCKRCVVATGGSVIYGPKAVARLKELGLVIMLDICLATFEQRVDNFRQRGFIHPPGQSLEEVFTSRRDLYISAADLRLCADGLDEAACVDWLYANLTPLLADNLASSL